MVKRGKRTRRNLNYAALAKGLQVSSDGENSGASPGRRSKDSTLNSTLGHESDESHEVDLDIARLKAEKQQLEAIKQLETINGKKRERERLAREVDALKKEYGRASGTSDTEQRIHNLLQNGDVVHNVDEVLPAPQLPVDVAPKDISLRELRNISKLSQDVDAQLARYGLNYATGGEEDTTRSGSTVSSRSNNGKGKLPNRHVISGRDSRVRDSVLKQIVWPHTRLEYVYSTTDILYCNLDPALLVAGEISVILTSGPEERDGRLRLLRKVMYVSKTYTWPAVRCFHEAILLEVERGVRDWASNDYREVEASTLFDHRIKHQQPATSGYRNTAYQTTAKTARKFFCMDFNRGHCAHQGNHEGQVGQSVQTVDHFCSACWRRNKQYKNHPEMSNDCPYRK